MRFTLFIPAFAAVSLFSLPCLGENPATRPPLQEQHWSIEYHDNTLTGDPGGPAVGYNFDPNFGIYAVLTHSQQIPGNDWLAVGFQGRYNLLTPRDIHRDFFQPFLNGGYYLVVNAPGDNLFLEPRSVFYDHLLNLGLGGEFLFRTHFGLGASLGFYQVVSSYYFPSPQDLWSYGGLADSGVILDFFLRVHF